MRWLYCCVSFALATITLDTIYPIPLALAIVSINSKLCDVTLYTHTHTYIHTHTNIVHASDLQYYKPVACNYWLCVHWGRLRWQNRFLICCEAIHSVNNYKHCIGMSSKSHNRHASITPYLTVPLVAANHHTLTLCSCHVIELVHHCLATCNAYNYMGEVLAKN